MPFKSPKINPREVNDECDIDKTPLLSSDPATDDVINEPTTRIALLGCGDSGKSSEYLKVYDNP